MRFIQANSEFLSRFAMQAFRPALDTLYCELADGGRTPRQPGQVRKEAAVTSYGPGRSSVTSLLPAAAGPG